MFGCSLRGELRGLVLVSLVLAFVNLISINVLVPSYVASLGGGVFLVGVVYSLMAAARGFSGALGGFLRDRVGGKIVLLLSVSVKMLAFTILFLAGNIPILALGLIVHAFGSGVEIPAFLSVVAVVAGETSFTATLFGFALTVKTMPNICAPALTGFLADGFGVRMAFFFGVIFSLASFLSLLKIKVEKVLKTEERIERVEFDRDFLLLLVATYFLFAAVSAFTPIFSYWVVEELKYSFTLLGLILAARSVVAAFSRIYTGMLADRLGNLNLLLGVGAVRATALALLPLARNPLEITLLVLLYGSLMAAPPRSAYISKIFSREDYGKAFGAISVAQNLGLMTGPVFAGYVAEHWGYFLTYTILSLLFVIFALLIALLKYRERRGEL